MEVILKEDIIKLGKALDVVNVKNGFANNFLFPRGLAIMATRQNKVLLERNRAKLEARLEAERAKSQVIIDGLNEVSVTISAKVHDGEKLFGSVSEGEIAARLAEAGHAIEKRHVSLDSPIKQLGVYTATIKLMSGVEGSVKVWVVAEEA
jgi:large subunit ribosomal protein L9